MTLDLNSPQDQFLFTHFRNPFLNLTNIAYDVLPMGTQQLYGSQQRKPLRKKIVMKNQLVKKFKNP